MLEKLYVTGLVILRSLLIPGRSPYPADSAAVEGEGYVQVTPNAISFHPAVLERLVGKEGKLALFIPGCLALAAPFVLFRLKRQGYSGCRVTSTGEGLFVDASR